MTLQRFDSFTLDLSSGELRKGGTPIKLHPQPAQLLGLFVKRAPEIVSREDIQKELWPDETFVDFDTGINSCVRQIRTALGDDAEKPRFIETVPKKGYRFVARLHSMDEAEVVESPKPARRFGLFVAWAAVLIGLVFVSYVISRFINAPSAPQVVSVEPVTEPSSTWRFLGASRNAWSSPTSTSTATISWSGLGPLTAFD